MMVTSIRNLSLLLLLSVSTVQCFSQNDDNLGNEKKSSNLKLAYNSSLIYSGARLGVEFPVKTTYVNKFRNSGKKRDFIRDLFVTINLSWYHHPQFHDNIYFTSGCILRRTKPNGFFTEFSPEIGYSRTFLGGTTYAVDNDGNISIRKLAGYNYAFISVGEGLGYDFSKTKSMPYLVYYKFNLFSMFPYNSTFYLRPAMELGLIYKPSDFLSIKTKQKKINR